MQYINGKYLFEVNQYENISFIFTSALSSDAIGNYFANTNVKKINYLIDLSDLE